MASLNYSYFLAVYKDKPEDTWFNVSFVNNCNREIKYLKIQSIESRCHKESGLSEIIGSLSMEYVNIPPGEYLLLEKLDSQDTTVDNYQYNLEVEVDGKTIRLSCNFGRDDFSQVFRSMLPVVNVIGKMYLCA